MINLGDELINSRTQNNYNRDKDKYRETRHPAKLHLPNASKQSETRRGDTAVVANRNQKEPCTSQRKSTSSRIEGFLQSARFYLIVEID